MRESYSNIQIGVADYAKTKDSYHYYSDKNKITYFNDGFILPDYISKGRGFEEGETVEVTVKLNQ